MSESRILLAIRTIRGWKKRLGTRARRRPTSVLSQLHPIQTKSADLLRRDSAFVQAQLHTLTDETALLDT